GEHQVPDQADQDQREGAPAQRCRQVRPEDRRPACPQGRRVRRRRRCLDRLRGRRQAAGQGRQQGRHPQEPGGQPQVGSGQAGRRHL
ncbi:MAG: SSU ribosomal protein S20p, partial [uncultured Blastococcus sp.]